VTAPNARAGINFNNYATYVLAATRAQSRIEGSARNDHVKNIKANGQETSCPEIRGGQDFDHYALVRVLI
jgi:hypothetical protein